MLTLRMRRCEQGVGLVELLVALVIVTLGLLSLAGLQANAVRYGKLSQYRVVAHQLATDITERIRANRTGNAAASSSAYAFTEKFTDQQDGAAQAPATPNPACNQVAPNGCTLQQMSAADLAQWRLSVRRMLPEGAVFLRPDGATAGSTSPAIDLWLAWSDPSDVTGGGRATDECPAGLDVGSKAQVRCLFYRVVP